MKDNNGTASVPLLKMKTGNTELVALLPVLVTLDVELDEELTLTDTDGVVLFVVVVLERCTDPRNYERILKVCLALGVSKVWDVKPIAYKKMSARNRRKTKKGR